MKSAVPTLFIFLIALVIASGCGQKKWRPIHPYSAPWGKVPYTKGLIPKIRMVYYNGYAKMRTITPFYLIDQVKGIVISAGGYVELIREGNAVFRVPVKEFQRHRCSENPH